MKVMLHISNEEQRTRLPARIDRDACWSAGRGRAGR